MIIEKKKEGSSSESEDTKKKVVEKFIKREKFLAVLAEKGLDKEKLDLMTDNYVVVKDTITLTGFLVALKATDDHLSKESKEKHKKTTLINIAKAFNFDLAFIEKELTNHPLELYNAAAAAAVALKKPPGAPPKTGVLTKPVLISFFTKYIQYVDHYTEKDLSDMATFIGTLSVPAIIADAKKAIATDKKLVKNIKVKGI